MQNISSRTYETSTSRGSRLSNYWARIFSSWITLLKRRNHNAQNGKMGALLISMNLDLRSAGASLHFETRVLDSENSIRIGEMALEVVHCRQKQLMAYFFPLMI